VLVAHEDASREWAQRDTLLSNLFKHLSLRVIDIKLPEGEQVQQQTATVSLEVKLLQSFFFLTAERSAEEQCDEQKFAQGPYVSKLLSSELRRPEVWDSEDEAAALAGAVGSQVSARRSEASSII